MVEVTIRNTRNYRNSRMRSSIKKSRQDIHSKRQKLFVGISFDIQAKTTTTTTQQQPEQTEDLHILTI